MEILTPSPRGSPAELLQGYMFIGFLFKGLLLGVMTTQVYKYFVTYSKKDRLWIQVFVAALYVALVLNFSFQLFYLHRVLITFYGDIEMLGQVYWSLTTEPATSGIIHMSVQLFFCRRIYILIKSMITALVVGGLSVTAGALALVSAYKMGLKSSLAELEGLRPVVTVCLVSSVLCDISISTILVFYLYKHKSGFPRSDMIINRIISATVQTCLITTLVVTADLVLFLADPSGKHFMLVSAISGLYATSLMTSLNSRQGWLHYGTEHISSRALGIDQQTAQFASMKTETLINRRTSPGVLIEVESHELRDLGSQNAVAFKVEKGRDLRPKSDIE